MRDHELKFILPIVLGRGGRELRLVFFCIVAFVTIVSGGAQGQGFSCAIGKQPACLDYGDKVCNSFAKCVSSDAVCFDSYTCGFEGFVCKSTLDDAIEERVDQYNKLVREYNELKDEAVELSEAYTRVRSEHEDLTSEVEDYVRCVQWAGTIERAQACAHP